jgi:hypothetical protein
MRPSRRSGGLGAVLASLPGVVAMLEPHEEEPQGGRDHATEEHRPPDQGHRLAIPCSSLYPRNDQHVAARLVSSRRLLEQEPGRPRGLSHNHLALSRDRRNISGERLR